MEPTHLAVALDGLRGPAGPTSTNREALIVKEAPSQSDLVKAARRGSQRAFSKLYELYAPVVHGAILARVPLAEVDDLVQDVFVIALRRLPSVRDPEKFPGWLLTIARNRAADFWRAHHPTDQLPEEVGTEATPGAEAAEVLAAIRELPEAYRETLVMRLVEGLTGPEIARRTGLTPASVRVNLHRGMKALRAKLDTEASR